MHRQKQDHTPPNLPTSRERRKNANRARHRLLSVQYDVEQYLKPLLKKKQEESGKSIRLVANERCGAWYALPLQPHASCHFKSTDGHVHLFSLKRLNLPFLKVLAEASNKHDEIVWVVDASNKKEMPDSFSRTIPIWSCVLNRIAERYRSDLGRPSLFDSQQQRQECLQLFLPGWIVPEEECAVMRSIIEDRVQELYESKAIVDVLGFVELMKKPLRPFWITPLHSEMPSNSVLGEHAAIICCNASNVRLQEPVRKQSLKEQTTTTASDSEQGNHQKGSRIVWLEEEGFWYTPGAADDEESWARHLTPKLFWAHGTSQANQETNCIPFSSSITESEVDEWIDTVVGQSRSLDKASGNDDCFDWIGKLDLAIGTRRAGRPSRCWETFDAILNVTNTEYEDMQQSITNGRFYLQMPVEEGKRDRSELERWMTVGILFCAFHALNKRRVLIHCAQGRDRSVAVAMAVAQVFGNAQYPLEWNHQVMNASVNTLLEEALSSVASHGPDISGLPGNIIPSLLGLAGRDTLLSIVGNVSADSPPSSKDSLRVVLHLIKQDRERAEPTRSTMQKLNRFFMSKAHKKPVDLTSPGVLSS